MDDMDADDRRTSGSNQPEFSVSEISYALKRTVEDAFSHVRVRGEIVGLKRAASGHVYLSLKDEQAVLSTVCWKGVAAKLPFVPEDGLEVVCSGKISTYPGRSNYQLIVEYMEPAGAGALMALLEKRRKMFEKEGLFDAAHKKPLPYLPSVIGVVTSPTGAVIRDILHRLEDRFPVHVIVWPVLVQGEGAAEQIAQAIASFNALPEGGEIARPDVLIVARGGGSLEDLWAFNEEIVVRAAFSSRIPLISAVGHETDTTLIDYVADRRAPTPTGAAEMAVPVREDLLATTMDLHKRMAMGMRRYLDERKTMVLACSRGLISPAQLLDNMTQRLDDRAERLKEALPHLLKMRQKELQLAASGLRAQPIYKEIEEYGRDVAALMQRMLPALSRTIETREEKVAAQAKLLESYHYKKVLQRGFVMVSDDKGKILASAADVAAGAVLSLEFRDGMRKAVADGSVKSSTRTLKKKQAVQKGSGGVQESLF